MDMSSVLVNVVVVASQICLNPKQRDFFNVIISVLEIGVSEKCLQYVLEIFKTVEKVMLLYLNPVISY